MMKGLLIKDFKLLKGQKQFYGAIALMMVIFLTINTNFSFVISYITLMTGVLTLSTISYDEYENGMGYLFTLPVSRREYVLEKYLFSIVTTVPVIIGVSGLVFAVSGIRHIEFTKEEYMASVAAGIVISTVMLSIMIPAQLKFGADKSRVAMMIVFGGGFAAVYISVRICEALGIDWEAGINRIDTLEPAVILLALVVICGILIIVSYLFSLRFLAKREF